MRLPRQAIAEGAEWVWVALISILSVGMPVASKAFCLAASSRVRPIMQVSTTQNAIRVVPSSNTKARAVSGSRVLSAERSVNMAFTRTGNFAGLMSTTLAPARNEAASGLEVSAIAAPSRSSGRTRRRGNLLILRPA